MTHSFPSEKQWRKVQEVFDECETLQDIYEHTMALMPEDNNFQSIQKYFPNKDPWNRDFFEKRPAKLNFANFCAFHFQFHGCKPPSQFQDLFQQELKYEAQRNIRLPLENCMKPFASKFNIDSMELNSNDIPKDNFEHQHQRNTASDEELFFAFVKGKGVTLSCVLLNHSYD